MNEEDEVFFKITRPIVFVFAMGAVLWFLAAVMAMFVLPLTITPSLAHDGDPSHDEWYMSLMQPDNPTVGCCGVSDAYWADLFEVSKDGEYIAIITDDRDDAPLRRPHVPVGTKIVVPNRKIKFDGEPPNPTGHGVIFLSAGRVVYCYVTPSGL